MFGVIIQNRRRFFFVFLSGLSFFASLLFLIWVGPDSAIGAASSGAVMAIAGIIFSRFYPDKYPSIWVHIGVGFLNVFLLAGVLLIAALFLKPLPETVLKIPRLDQKYLDPEGVFELKGPWGWDYQPIKTASQSGVLIIPRDRGQYIGINEIRIMVMKLPRKPVKPGDFLRKFEESLADSAKNFRGKKLFQMKTGSAKLLLGGQGVWSEIEVRPRAAFSWFPLTEITLLGIKQGDSICSISAAGPSAHATLFKLMCLGLFEKLTIKALQKNSI